MEVLACVMAGLATAPAGARAQTVEITPFGGYRVGGGVSEIATGRTLDDDGARSLGVLVNVDFGSRADGVKVEGLFSHEEVRVDVRPSPFDPPALIRVEVDHAQVGGIQEFGHGRARPFLSGLIGLTRYAAPGDTEVRFSIGSGGGVKLFATPHLGVRLDGRAYVTFVDVDSSGVCGWNHFIMGM